MNKNIFKAVTLGMLLSTGCCSFVEATSVITGGTHDISGEITFAENQYVLASSDVVLNLTGATKIISTTIDAQVFRPSALGVGITVNGDNHDLAIETKGRVGYIVEYTDETISINNVHDFKVAITGGDSNGFYSNQSNFLLNVQASNDIDLYSAVSGRPLITSQNAGAFGRFSLQAGHDINLQGASNLINIKNEVEVNVIAGNDIKLIGDSFNSPPVYVTDGAICNFTAGGNFINHGDSNPFNVKSDGKLNVIAGENIDVLSSGSSGGIFLSGAEEVNFTAQKGSFTMSSTGGNTCSLVSDAGVKTTISAAKDVNVGGNARQALRARGGSVVNITAGEGYAINITATNTSGGNNVGLYTENANSTINLHSPTIISAITSGVDANNGKVAFDKELSIKGAETAIKARNGGGVEALNTTSSKKIEGNILSDGAGSKVDLALETMDSFLTGSATTTRSGAIDLSMKNSSLWNVTADSSVTNLNNSSTVNMRYSGNNINETLTVDNLMGDGLFVMNTDLLSSYNNKDVTTSGDKIVLTTSSNGNHLLDLRDISLDTTLQAEGYLLLVEDQSSGSATFSGKDLDHGGIFKYKPVITTDNPVDFTGFNAGAKNWYLTGFEKTLEVSSNTKASLGLSETRYANYVMDNDTLLKRLGELRMLKDEEDSNGIWTRYRHGGTNGENFDGSFTTFQLGYDKKTSNKRFTGIAFSHTTNSFSLGEASSEGSMDALSIYNTWLGDKGHYFDIVGKIGRMRGNSDYRDKLFPEKGDYTSNFYSLSGEYGKKNIKDNGFYYEPQFQLTLGRISGDDYITSNGNKISQDAITSLLGRVGVTFGRELNKDKSEKHSNVYAKINYMREFKGDVSTNLMDNYGDSYGPTKEYGGSWLNVGLGATVSLSKGTHLYADLEKNFGGDIKTSWVAQVGCRFLF